MSCARLQIGTHLGCINISLSHLINHFQLTDHKIGLPK